MSSVKTKKLLDAIVNKIQKDVVSLKDKLVVESKKNEWKMPPIAEDLQAEIINSDSEREANELFEMVDSEEEEKQGLLILIDSAEKMDEEKPEEDKRSISNNKPNNESNKEKSKKKSDSKSKSVSYYEEEKLIYTLSADKKWKEGIQNQKKGKFSIGEQRAIGDAVGQFLACNQISLQDFTNLISQGCKESGVLRRQKFFKLLASVLPDRSPLSCYRYIMRNFHSSNRKGQWSKQQVQKLLSLVEKYGRKWKLIAKELNRTSDNVYDKYRSLGQESMDERVKNFWKLSQIVTMLAEVQRQSKIQFLDHNIKHELNDEELHNRKEMNQIKVHKYNTKHFTFNHFEITKNFIDAHLLKSVNLETIQWKKLTRLIPTKSVYDCRNKMLQLLQVLFRNEQELDLLVADFIQKQAPREELNINWKHWKNSSYTVNEAKNRYVLLKKHVMGRIYKPYPQILKEIGQKVRKRGSNNPHK